MCFIIVRYWDSSSSRYLHLTSETQKTKIGQKREEKINKYEYKINVLQISLFIFNRIF